MTAPFTIGQVLTAAEMNDIAQPPQARVFRITSSFTSNSGTHAVLQFNSTDYDPLGMVSLGGSNPLFTIPAGAGGLYLLKAQYEITLSAAQWAQLDVVQNGTTISSQRTNDTGIVFPSDVKIIEASAGDTIQAFQLTSTSALTISPGTANTYMEICRISK
jgi:hypothetical protein